MSIITAQSYLAANLNSLGSRNADVGESLDSATHLDRLEFIQTPQGISVTLDGKQLSSRQRPMDEAARLVDDVDLVEHAVVVILGFGAGYHVQKLAQRAGKATLIVVFEPDLALLRGVLEHIDHSSWMRDALVLLITDPTDRGALGRKLEGAESILAQGVAFVEHPPSRARLAASAAAFSRTFSEYITTAKTTLVTTLMRSADTVRNLMLNIDHYAAGAGILELQNAAPGCPAVVVSAGPSLHKNVHLLAGPGIRQRCIIIAVQTTLKPLLDAGIRPHFVTALDYHEISKRFYEGLNEEDLRDVTLIADPKAHPVILDSFPGPVRCCGNGFLDQLLGPHKRDMGTVPAGATVAHLGVYLAKYLGCNPIAMIGQDLGFTDGLYYAPGAAIHDVWATELNPFNTIEMMEWQRIARHRLHLRKVKDVSGKSIYTDAQMHTYLQQFERDFAQYKREGLTIIDASEGGVAKQHASTMPLAEFLNQHATRTLPALLLPGQKRDGARLRAAQHRLDEIRTDVRRLKHVSQDTQSLIRNMIDDQHDPARMNRHFQKIEKNRKEVERRMPTFELLNQINQMGVFKRLKADRRLHMQQHLDPMSKQRGQLERDLENVTWIADAASEMLEQLELSTSVLRGESAQPRSNDGQDQRPVETSSSSRIAALIPIDIHRNGLGIARSLAEPFNGRSVLQATLERLGTSQTLQSIILIVARRDDVSALIDPSRISLPVEIEVAHESPFGPEHEAIAAARLWSDTCWRGGIGGMSIYDEILCPQVMHEIMRRRGMTAALLVGPDWPLVHVSGCEGCDAIVRRHLEHPAQHNLVFTQSPPGICGCLISATLMSELAQRNRLSTVGGLLVYQPHAPQHDPIARDVNVQINHQVRRSLVRATFDTPRQRERIKIAMSSLNGMDLNAVDAVAAIENSSDRCDLPQHVTLELCTHRTSRGILARHPFGPIDRAPLDIALAERLLQQIGEVPDAVLRLAGVGDPLLHPQFDRIVQFAKQCGIRAVGLRTELLVDRAVLDRLLNCGIDVVSVDLHADRADTYQRMMGLGGDRFKDVLINIEYLLQNRRRLTAQSGTAAFALPWIVPHLQRRAETYEDIDTFFDRWQHMLGAAVIEGPPPFDTTDMLTPAVTPPRVRARDRARSMMIFCDGSVPLDEWDWPCSRPAGNASQTALREIWKAMSNRDEETSS